MRKVLLTAVAAVVALGSFAVISQAGKGVGGTSWNFEYQPNDVDKAVKTDSLILPAIKMDDGSYAETSKTTIFFTPTTEFDTSVPPRCTASGGELVSSNGDVCKNAQIGQGDALAQVGTLETAAEIKAYNRKTGIYFLVTSCNPGTGPGQDDPNCTPLEGGTFALVGKLKYADDAKQKPFLVVPTPQTLLDGNITITRFHLETDKIVKKGETYIESPERCRRGKFKTKAKIEYDTAGVDNQIIKDSQPC